MKLNLLCYCLQSHISLGFNGLITNTSLVNQATESFELRSELFCLLKDLNSAENKAMLQKKKKVSHASLEKK